MSVSKSNYKAKEEPHEDGNLVDDGSTGVETEETHSEETIIRPFDPTLIRVETKPMTVDLIVSRIKEAEIDLTPGFQRKAGIWTEGAQSRLIESMLIRIPLPAFYMDATNEDKWLIVDGLQRITTIKSFVIDKKFKLTELEFLPHLHDKTFDKLPRNFQRRILETQITAYLIEKGTPAAVKYTIFKRINTGGLPLSAQEIRHALNQGKATQLLAELADSNEFKLSTDYGIRDQRMADRECVLRFLAFAIVPYSEYKVPDLDAFLNDRMAKINQLMNRDLKNLKDRFLHSMKAAREIFGNLAFRKYYGKQFSRHPINKALFEAWSVNLDKLTDDQLQRLISRKDTLMKKFILLMQNTDFEKAVSQGTGDVSKVRLRFSRIEALIQEVLS
ncbi:MAG: DUF262 domain-containing protein [bacterium]